MLKDLQLFTVKIWFTGFSYLKTVNQLFTTETASNQCNIYLQTKICNFDSI